MKTRSIRRFRFLLVIGLLLLVVLGPVLTAQLRQEPGRRMTGVALSELEYSEVEFRNQAQGIDLAGLLFVPDGEGPHPAAVLIHGSGTSNRGNGWYSTLVHDLVESGIAVLLPDKRGSEASGGDWRTSSFEDLATDTVAAVDFLASLDEPAISGIGVVGMSQGGWIAPVAASRSGRIEYLVSFSGATVTPHEQLYFEEVHNLRQLGILPGIAQGIAVLSRAWIVHIGQRGFWDGIADFDPAPLWNQLDIQALLLYGEDDTNVPVSRSMEIIDSLDKPGLRVVVFEGSGHAIQEPLGTGNRIIRPDASRAITEFILEQAGKS